MAAYRCGDDDGMFWVVIARDLQHAQWIMVWDEDADLSKFTHWEQIPGREAAQLWQAPVGSVFRAAR